MVGIIGVPRILIPDGLTPFGVSVACIMCVRVSGLRVSSAVCQFFPENFVLVSSVRPNGVRYP